MDSVCASDLAGFFRAASLANLEAKRMITVHGADRPVLLCWHEVRYSRSTIVALPGFPLSKAAWTRFAYLPWHHAPSIAQRVHFRSVGG